MVCDFRSSTVFQSYQDSRRVIMKDCVQWNDVYERKISLQEPNLEHLDLQISAKPTELPWLS